MEFVASSTWCLSCSNVGNESLLSFGNKIISLSEVGLLEQSIHNDHAILLDFLIELFSSYQNVSLKKKCYQNVSLLSFMPTSKFFLYAYQCTVSAITFYVSVWIIWRTTTYLKLVFLFRMAFWSIYIISTVRWKAKLQIFVQADIIWNNPVSRSKDSFRCCKILF